MRLGPNGETLTGHNTGVLSPDERHHWARTSHWPGQRWRGRFFVHRLADGTEPEQVHCIASGLFMNSSSFGIDSIALTLHRT
jgi:hypothetical protein